ncbi:MAG: AraC family transcriptional regulator [Longimicrobiales bacterium]
MRYREHAPGDALAALVRCYWTVTGAGSPTTPVNRVLPDGCMDIIFDLRSGVQRGVVVGAMLEASVFHMLGPLDMLGVRFVPGAAPLFLGSDASELTTQIVPADNVWRDADELAGQLFECGDHSRRLQILNEALLRRLQRQRAQPAALQGMALIERAHGQLRLDLLCRSLNVSERTLQRTFASQVGLTPKQAIRIMRFRGALQLMHIEPRATLAQVALRSGYADQAHFTREFRELAAATPAEFRRETGLVGFVQDGDSATT